jgi:hypothetical protein
MKKTLPLLVVGILVLSGLGAVAVSIDQQSVTREKTSTISLASQPMVQSKGEYVEVTFEGTNSMLLEDGKPQLPIYVENFVLPVGVTNIKVECTSHEISTMEISGEITPATKYYIGIENPNEVDLVKDEVTYSSNALYPSSWYSVRTGQGLDGREHATFVNVYVNVVRYAPADNTLHYINGMDIKITYDEGDIQQTSMDEYDLVIITPQKFQNVWQKLANHKIDLGIDTLVKTVEDIYDEYDGYDAPEDVKLFILDAYETMGAEYFLLGGGLKSHINADDKDNRNEGSTDWYVPVRYTNIPEDNGHGVISDLYYADIYKTGQQFEDWDSNDDHIYAAWDFPGDPDDVLDLYPDVFVSRLPCRNKLEVRIIVNKIIKYESTGPGDKDWYSTMIGIAGKTFELYGGQPDGEYLADLAFTHMNTIVDNEIRCYASNRDTGDPTCQPDDIVKEFRGGSGFVLFQGHGNPMAWNTHWHDNDEWVGNTNIYDILRLTNGKKLPVVVIGGCHNALFNISLVKSMDDEIPTHWYWTYGRACPVSFSFELLLIPYGGAIASTGCTGYGIGYVGMPLSLSAQLESNFFHQTGQAGANTPAESHAGSVTKYLNENPGHQSVDAFCMTEFQLFADPSMQYGGY